MAVNYEQPRVKQMGRGVSVETHPSYGSIAVTRGHGHAVLYGSDFHHQHFVTVSIRGSELHRSLSNDWHHSTNEIIEVMMSEAQWAAFVASVGVGDGVCCTIRHINLKLVPQLENPPNRRSQFKDEVKGRLEMTVKAISALERRINDAKLSQTTRKELLGEMETVRRNVLDNVDFVAKQFDEHMEATVERAKTEISTFIQGFLARVGLKGIKNDDILKLIGHDKEETKP